MHGSDVGGDLFALTSGRGGRFSGFGSSLLLLLLLLVPSGIVITLVLLGIGGRSRCRWFWSARCRFGCALFGSSLSLLLGLCISECWAP